MANRTKRQQGNNKGQGLQIAKTLWAKYALVLWFLAVAATSNAQLLSTELSINANRQPLSKVLFQLSEQAHFDFSYDTRVIAPSQTVSINAQNQPLGQVLNGICAQSNIQYKVLGNQIIFFGASQEETRRVSHLISGQVTDYQTGEVLQGVRVSERYFRLNTNTNAEGSYQLSVPNPDYTIQLTYDLEGYQKKSYLVKLSDNKTLNVSLKSKAEPKETATAKSDTVPALEPITFPQALATQMLDKHYDTVKMQQLSQPITKKKSLMWLIPKKQLDSLELDSTLTTVPFQFSVVPGVGLNANGKSYVKGFSLNLFGGLNAGVNGFEAASIFNLNRFNVRGFQAAGMVNIVGGQTNGFQAAGLVNISRLKAHGFQAAGFYNFAGKEMHGFQAAGFINFVRGNAQGTQAAGFYNIITDSADGTQLSGFGNTVGGNYRGVQATGFINIVNGKIYGTQAAGFINLAKEVNGTQIAGFMNYTGKLRGLQIGVFNFADTVESGAPIGVFNYVRKGYRRWEVQGNETGIVSLKFKSGTHRFYTYVGLGGKDMGSGNNSFLWDIHYGAGTILRPQKPLFCVLELSSHWLNPGVWSDQINNLYRLDFDLGVRLYKRFAVTVGPAVNLLVIQDKFEPITPLNQPHNFFVEKINNTWVKGWLGLSAAVQF